MIKRLAIKFIKGIDFDKRETRDQIKRVLRLKFIEFCKEKGVENTISAYKEYRAVIRSIYGFDLAVQRPCPKHDKVETAIELF